ncbi:hypothetical protein [Streptomyces bluensis]|uniref:hypothetical protein n=1 Tax=Streptomyces bluensis TaxID=33897 RepID=UPI0019BADF5E|nr:hypothetical protein [Streptomyces bluensis]GGZ94776.1 hypothetical protein GCM10010344_73370 [Streptomyces bluensis]
MAHVRADPVRGVPGGRPVEIACDESGSDGENLTSGNTDVFAHASVHLPVEFAAHSVQVIRDRIRSPAEEYKANHLLREKHRAVLEWLLDTDGPLYGHAHVHLTEKSFFVVDRMVDLLLGETGTTAATLYREGRNSFGDERWRAFLESSNRLLRVRNNGEAGAPVDAFFHMIDALSWTYSGDPSGNGLGDILAALLAARSRADAYRARIAETPAIYPVLNPLLPAIVRTAAHWSGGGRPVSLVHDRQNMLTEDRIAWLKETARLAGLRLVAARSDPRVQLADFLAGIARKIASDERGGRGDARLTTLLRPYVDPYSVWGDDRSWAVLGPVPEAATGRVGMR